MLQSAHCLLQGDVVSIVHVLRIQATRRVSCVRTDRRHVRLCVSFLLLSCTTIFRASGLHSGSSVAANRGVEGGKQNDRVPKFQKSDVVDTRVLREKQNDIILKVGN